MIIFKPSCFKPWQSDRSETVIQNEHFVLYALYTGIGWMVWGLNTLEKIAVNFPFKVCKIIFNWNAMISTVFGCFVFFSIWDHKIIYKNLYYYHVMPKIPLSGLNI